MVGIIHVFRPDTVEGRSFGALCKGANIHHVGEDVY